MIGTDWTISGVADFNGDGKADLLWSNANGDRYLWNSNASGGFAAVDLGVIGTDWQVAAVGQYDGAAGAGVLWRNANGDAYLWDPTAPAALTPTTSAWSRRVGRRSPELLHHHLRPLLHPLVEVDDVGVEHADAAGRNRLADALGLVGAVDAEQRVLVVLEQIERAGAERIAGPPSTWSGRSRWRSSISGGGVQPGQ